MAEHLKDSSFIPNHDNVTYYQLTCLHVEYFKQMFEHSTTIQILFYVLQVSNLKWVYIYKNLVYQQFEH